MITKEQAIYNISKAYLDYSVSNRLYWDTLSTRDTEREYHKDAERVHTMRQCYLECDVLTMDEIETATSKKYKLEKIKPAE